MTVIPYYNRISPYPLFIKGIGHLKSPTLKKIYMLSYEKYYVYLSFINMTPAQYLKLSTATINDSLKSKIMSLETIYPLIIGSEELQNQYVDIFNFFFVDQIKFNTVTSVFEVYNDNKICGYINDINYTDVCNLISSLNNISVKEKASNLKFKNEKAKEVYEFLEIEDNINDKKKDEDENMALGNIISAVCARHNSINMINVWDMTVCQLYDQFFRLYLNVPFDIRAIRWAAYGEDDYDYKMWYNKIE